MDPHELDKLTPCDNGHQAQPRRRLSIIPAPTAGDAAAKAETPAEKIEEGYYRLIISIKAGLLPPEDAAQLLHPDGTRFDYEALAKRIWEDSWLRGDPLAFSGEELIRVVRKIAKTTHRLYRIEADKELKKVQSFLANIPTMCARLALLAEPPGEPGSKSLVDVNQLFAEALNLVRGATGRIIVKWHGEGIRDTDADRLEQLLLTLGQDLKAGPGPEVGTRAELVADLLTALNAYEPKEIESEFRLLRAGSRLLIGLAGAESYFGIFAQLDLYAVLDRLMSREEFLGTMRRLADQMDPLTDSRDLRDLIRRLNADRAEAEWLPTATRLRSYALGNLALSAIDAALAEATPNEARGPFVAQARTAAEQVATKDGRFECLRWYQLAIAATTAQVTGDDQELRETLRRFGEIECLAISEEIEKHFNHPNLTHVLGKLLPTYLNAGNQRPKG